MKKQIKIIVESGPLDDHINKMMYDPPPTKGWFQNPKEFQVELFEWEEDQEKHWSTLRKLIKVHYGWIFRAMKRCQVVKIGQTSKGEGIIVLEGEV